MSSNVKGKANFMCMNGHPFMNKAIVSHPVL